MTDTKKKKRYAYPVRMPEEIRQWLTDRAQAQGRSINGEINQILKKEKAAEMNAS